MNRKTLFILYLLIISIVLPFPQVKADGSTDAQDVMITFTRNSYTIGGTADGDFDIEADTQLQLFNLTDLGYDIIQISSIGIYCNFDGGSGTRDIEMYVYEYVADNDAGNIIGTFTGTVSSTNGDRWAQASTGSDIEVSALVFFVGGWVDSTTGDATIYYEDDSGTPWVRASPGKNGDPFSETTSGTTSEFRTRISFDGYENTTTTFNEYYGSATDYVARRDINYTFPASSINRELRNAYPRNENLVNISYLSGDFNNALSTEQYTNTLYNGTHDIITIPEDTIDAVGSTFRVFTQTNEFNYDLYGPYFPNGTRAPAINVTVSHPALTEELELDGHLVFGYETQPVMVSWAFDTGATRHIFLTSSETLYAFVSEETHYIYDFTIKDYTGKLGLGNAYLELYKSVNASELLIERMIIHDAVNTVPVYLLPGSVYHIKILWADNTRYDWGYYVAGIDNTLTISVRNVVFDQQTQMTYKYLRVTASRPSLTLINVDYEDTLDQTNWVNITISPRLGVVEHSESSNQSSKVFNWAGATNTTDYKIIVYIDHVKFGLKTVVLYADTTKVYDDFVDPEVLGSYGALSTGNLVAFSLAVIFMGAFSYEFGSTAGIVSGLTVVSLMTAWGATTYTYNFLALCWFVGIIMILRVVRT